jgi:excinuclease ABC subunit C
MQKIPLLRKDVIAFLTKLPKDPGIYKFIGRNKSPIYIGKAKNIRKRVSSYFQNSKDKPQKIVNLMDEAEFLHITVTNNELEALLLEQNQIKEIRPKFNVQFKDDKGYPWIKISSSKKFPSAKSFLGKKEDKDKLYGPYPNSYAVKDALGLIQKVFKIRNCNDSVFKNRSRPCLQFEIGRCSAPCVNLINREDYCKDVNSAQMLLEGKSEELLSGFYLLMDNFSNSQQYEKAAGYRDKISALRDIQRNQSIGGFKKERDAIALCIENGAAKIGITRVKKGWITGHENFTPKTSISNRLLLEAFLKAHYLNRSYCPGIIVLQEEVDDKPLIEKALSRHHGKKVRIITKPGAKDKGLLQIARSNTMISVKRSSKEKNDISSVLMSLKETLNLKKEIKLIESYDISHHSGAGAVAGCVTYSKNGKVKEKYRLFNISLKNAGNDIASMKEAIERRFLHNPKKLENPDLIIIDGGKTHLKAIKKKIDSLRIKGIELISISKGARRKLSMDSIHTIDGSVIRIAQGSRDHFLLQEIRDETHRFSIENQKKKRAKQSIKSTLDSINGIGEIKRKLLLRYFGSVNQLERASILDLSNVPGIGPKLAKLIYNHLH